MNRDLKILVELDSLFDYRRGLIQWLATEGIEDPIERKAKGDGLWDDHFKKAYDNRRLDIFDFQGHKLNDKYQELLPNRSYEHWLMYYPTNLSTDLLKTVFDIEGFDERPVDLRTITMYVNTNQYDLTQELKDELIQNCTNLFKGLVIVKLIDQDNSVVTSSFYSHFDYVFRYDILSGRDTEVFMNSLKEHPIPETCFLVPNILVKEIEDIKGNVDDRIFAWSVTVAPSIKIIPVNHKLYDYIE